jgi:hypothetical protein
MSAQLATDGNLQKPALRLEADKAARGAAFGSFAEWTVDSRFYSSSDLAEAFEKAAAFIAAAEDLPIASDDRALFIAAGLAMACEGLYRQSRRSTAEPAALRAPARLITAKAALLKRCERNVLPLPSAWWYVLRVLLRPATPEMPHPPLLPTLAYLRLAGASLFCFGEVIHDSPRLRTARAS